MAKWWRVCGGLHTYSIKYAHVATERVRVFMRVCLCVEGDPMRRKAASINACVHLEINQLK